MHGKVKTTKMVGGRSFNETFFDDLITLKEFPLEKQIELIDKALEWFPREDSDAEWEEWTKDLSDDDKEKTMHAFRILLFMVHEGIKKKFTDEDFINDLGVFELPEESIDYFVKKLDEKKEEIVKKIAEREIRVLPEITDVNWVINRKISDSFRSTIDELGINLVIEYREKDKLDTIVFETNVVGLRSLMDTLQLVYEEVMRCQ